MTKPDTTREPSTLTIQLEPTPEALQALLVEALDLQNAGQLDAARVRYEQVLKYRPNDSDALHLSGMIAFQTKQYRLAIDMISRSLQSNPGHIAALKHLGLAFAGLKQEQSSIACYQRALSLMPDDAEAYMLLGNSLSALEQWEQAEKSYRKAISLKADTPETYLNFGVLYKNCHQMQAALEQYDLALKVKPDYAEAWVNRGAVLRDIKRLDEALICYDKAIAIKPDLVEAHWNKTIVQLLKGDYAAGWLGYEWRWSKSPDEVTVRHFDSSLWLGKEDLRGKRILLFAEQGLGDTLQFVRYAKNVAALGATVLLEVSPPLVTLMSRVEGVSLVFARGQQPPAHDFNCPLMSLPLAFKSTLATIPSGYTYLSAKAEKIQYWQSKLGPRQKPRLGLVWSGSAKHKNDWRRSLSLQNLLASIPEGFQCISLQKEVRQTDLDILTARQDVLHFGPALLDFEDTAALCELVDVVVSVDTSVLHLAAALGRPTWALLAYSPDWRWLLDRSDSPWYPSVKLFRQHASGDWAGLLQDLFVALQSQLTPSLETRLGLILAQALKAHRSGKYNQAKQLYAEMLVLSPDNFDALHLSGAIASQEGRHQDALALITKALSINSNSAIAHSNLGAIQQKLGQFQNALVSHETAIALDPKYVQAIHNKGNVLMMLGRRAEAQESYQKVISLSPNFSPAHKSLGDFFQQTGQHREAIECFDRAIALDEKSFDAHMNRGNALLDLNQLVQALASYDKAISLNSQYPGVYSNRGIVLQRLRQLEASVASYRKAIALKPDYPQAYSNLGLTLQDLKRPADAIDSYNRALELKPDYAEAYFNRGNAFQDLRQLDCALDSYDRALELNTDIEFLLGSQLYVAMQICDWTDFDSRLQQIKERVLRGKKTVNPFAWLALTESEALHRRCAEIWTASKHPPGNSLPPLAPYPKHERIRVGYFSADLHSHPVACLAVQLFELHDRSKFEFTAFYYGPDTQDRLKQRIQNAFEHFIDVREYSDVDVARLARSRELDIAVDLGGYTKDQRTGIFAERAAPVQVNYLGYPGTMGATYYDYIIADPTVIPASARQDYVEKVAYLPDTYQANDTKRQISEKVFTREELGLPPKGFVFCCFNNNFKILPDMFALWMRILKQVPNSVLWLFQDNPIAKKNLQQAANDQGIDSSRIVFATRFPTAEHLARHRVADLFLDTLPYNAHTTASDALWAGLPLLTCMGASFASRVAASLLNAIQVPELIANNLEEYERRAIELANDFKQLAYLRKKLAQNITTSALFDSAKFTRNIEALYNAMYARHSAGLAPAHLEDIQSVAGTAK